MVVQQNISGCGLTDVRIQTSATASTASPHSNIAHEPDNVQSTPTPGIRRNYDGYLSDEGNWCLCAQRAHVAARLHHFRSAIPGRPDLEDAYRKGPRRSRGGHHRRGRPGSQPTGHLDPKPAPSLQGHERPSIRADRFQRPGTHDLRLWGVQGKKDMRANGSNSLNHKLPLS